MAQKILVCDDEKSIVRLVEVNLQQAGYEVVKAHNGVECLAMVDAEQPDLIVLDVMMPEMTGFEVLEKLKANEATQHIPVIMLTGEVQDADVLHGWQGGVEYYLTKPFNPTELLKFVTLVFAPKENKVVEKRYVIE